MDPVAFVALSVANYAGLIAVAMCGSAFVVLCPFLLADGPLTDAEAEAEGKRFKKRVLILLFSGSSLIGLMLACGILYEARLS